MMEIFSADNVLPVLQVLGIASITLAIGGGITVGVLEALYPKVFQRLPKWLR